LKKQSILCSLCLWLLTVCLLFTACAAQPAPDTPADEPAAEEAPAEKAPAEAPSGSLEYWTLTALERDTEGSAPSGTKDITLYAALGETESFHVVAQSTSGSIQITDFAVSELKSADGVIGTEAIELYRQHYVDTPASPISARLATKSEAGLLPDGLIALKHPETSEPPAADAAIAVLPAEATETVRVSFFVDITVPRDAKPGEYEGTYTLTTDAGDFSGKIKFTVWHFELPEQPRLNSSFYLSVTYPTAAPYREILKCRLQPNIARIDGLDGDMDELLNELKKDGLYMADLKLFSGATYQISSMKSAPKLEEVTRVKNLYPQDILLYSYFADEIDEHSHLFPKVIEWAEVLREAGVKPLVVMTPCNAMFYEDGSSVLDYYVVMPQHYMDHKVQVRRAQKAGAEVWSYNCVGYSTYGPTWFTDYPLINFRIQAGFMNAQTDLTGLLYWQMDYYQYGNPWEKAVGFGSLDRLFVGDGQMVYPGRDVGYPGTIMPSLRLKALRDGVDDYDYYSLLCDAGLGDWAKEQMSASAKDFYLWVPKPEVLENARLTMGQKLDELAKYN